MKKLNIFTVLLISMIVAFTGCSSDQNKDKNGTDVEQNNSIDKNDEQKNEEQEKTEERLSDRFAKLMSSKEYMMKYKTTSEMDGQAVEMEMTMAVSGENTAMTMKSNLDSNNMSFVNKDKKTYIINHQEKIVMEFPNDGANDMVEGMSESFTRQELETNGMIFSNSGKGEFQGKTYNYEEYKVEDGYIRYYFDGNDLIGMEITNGEYKMTWEIIEFSEKVDKKLFEIPTDYQVMNLGV